MCWIGLSDLLKSSGIDPANSRNLVIFSSTKGNITQLVDEKNRNENFQRFNLFSSAETITKRLGFFHPPQVISNACISGLIGILVANRWLHSGSFDNVFLIGADIVTDFVLQGFQSLLALSDHACTPFDKNRSGINLGEAVAGMVIRRNTNKGLCSIISGNVTNDAEHISSPSRTSSGLIDSIRKTLTGNDLPDFINAHGTGTRYNDEAEARAFLQTGLSNCPVLGLKGHFGHTLGAAGILETIFGIECMRKGELFPVAGFKEGDEAYPINVQKKRISLPLQHFLKSASGFGGCNATALFRNSA